MLKFTYHDSLDELFQRQMYESALRDDLTKTFNKKYFTDRLESEYAFAMRTKSPLSLVVFDLDHFKEVNDTYGHPAGDEVLAEVAHVVAALIRAEDVFARVGGEEFGVICRATDSAQAQAVAERMRQTVAAHQFDADGRIHPHRHQRRHGIHPAIRRITDAAGARRGRGSRPLRGQAHRTQPCVRVAGRMNIMHRPPGKGTRTCN